MNNFYNDPDYQPNEEEMETIDLQKALKLFDTAQATKELPFDNKKSPLQKTA